MMDELVILSPQFIRRLYPALAAIRVAHGYMHANVGLAKTQLTPL